MNIPQVCPEEEIKHRAGDRDGACQCIDPSIQRHAPQKRWRRAQLSRRRDDPERQGQSDKVACDWHQSNNRIPPEAQLRQRQPKLRVQRSREPIGMIESTQVLSRDSFVRGRDLVFHASSGGGAFRGVPVSRPYRHISIKLDDLEMSNDDLRDLNSAAPYDRAETYHQKEHEARRSRKGRFSIALGVMPDRSGGSGAIEHHPSD
nr:hypothetical protein [Rhodomicrobium vannielii]